MRLQSVAPIKRTRFSRGQSLFYSPCYLAQPELTTMPWSPDCLSDYSFSGVLALNRGRDRIRSLQGASKDTENCPPMCSSLPPPLPDSLPASAGSQPNGHNLRKHQITTIVGNTQRKTDICKSVTPQVTVTFSFLMYRHATESPL